MRKVGRVLVSIAAFLVVWKGASFVAPAFFPPPDTVVGTAIDFSVNGDIRGRSALWHLSLTLWRVALATGVAVGLSVVIGILMGLSSTVEDIVSFWLPIWMTPPDIVVILVTMIVVGFNTTAVVLAVSFVYTPFGLVNIWEGVQDIEGDLVEMAGAFDADQWLMWRRVFVPQLLSYIFAAVRYVFGMTWKVAVIAEVLGIDAGVGAQIRFWYTQGEVAMVLAYTVLIVGVVLLIEYGGLQPIQRRAFAWRTMASE
jgi:NitT/TauT family transport system permease protein